MEGFSQLDKYVELHLLEKQRIKSFKHWPFDENCSCNIMSMAAAGFYWSGNKREVDTATCFVCQKTLDGWEASDDPWKEHTKHAPQCLFVKYGKAEQDLKLEEFLYILSAVLKNQMQRDISDSTKQFQIDAQHMLTAMISKK